MEKKRINKILLLAGFVTFFSLGQVCYGDEVYEVIGSVDELTLSYGGTGVVDFTITNKTPQTRETAAEIDYIGSKHITVNEIINTCNQTLAPGASCNMTAQIISGNTPGRFEMSPRVCAYSGHLCSQLRTPINIYVSRLSEFKNKLVCWGYNAYGQLGTGDTTNSDVPINTVGLDAENIKQVDLGYRHTCALMKSGGVKCWGWNQYGQVGDGSTTNRLTPKDVSGLSSGVESITTGGVHTCAKIAGDGMKCWGYNLFG